MASPILRFNHKSNVVFSVLVLLCVTLLIQKSGAAEFAISWSAPNASAPHLDQWAENNRFQIGDSIVFNYSPGQDSVLRVNQDDYTNCNTDAPTAKYTDGHTAIKFDQSGPFYFISGNKDNCLKNEKVVVIVLADRTNRNATAPSPSNSTDITPSPAPAGEASPPSPDTGVVENPTLAPESPPPPSGASPVFMSLLGSIGAFAASSSLLLL
ncbi:unnamed protein product [Prunus armeniaca]|uniref:Phytocyanin domain-containing protein n=1 Tax=Prunus armeniaca TaxID=36596 RepID=A0A6J5UPD0_PRUAR|nr:hypothetical protein GBA52_014046 [Prunus armeniaca]CAB4277733.1 unnamed protein product [Prunus armeniaca]